MVFSSEDDNVDDEEGTENESEVDVVTSEKDGDVKMGEKEDVTEKEGKKQASKSKKKKQKKKEVSNVILSLEPNADFDYDWFC